MTTYQKSVKICEIPQTSVCLWVYLCFNNSLCTAYKYPTARCPAGLL